MEAGMGTGALGRKPPNRNPNLETGGFETETDGGNEDKIACC